MTNFQPCREDVLYAFAVEPESGRETLEQYLQKYPQYADDLIDLAYELSQATNEEETPLSGEDLTTIEQSWQRYADAISQENPDPLACLSPPEQSNLAKSLGVPRQVITAFREHRVELASVPLAFLRQLAAAVDSTIEVLLNTQAYSSASGLSRSYKADSKPKAQLSITFEQVLIEAEIPLEKRTLLLKDES
jgi:plasmid maintenance system antidote protein VapI